MFFLLSSDSSSFFCRVLPLSFVCLFLYLHKQSLYYSMNYLFYSIFYSQILLRKNVFNLINHQLLSTAKAKEINTDYYITNSTLASKYHASVV